MSVFAQTVAVDDNPWCFTNCGILPQDAIRQLRILHDPVSLFKLGYAFYEYHCYTGTVRHYLTYASFHMLVDDIHSGKLRTAMPAHDKTYLRNLQQAAADFAVAHDLG